MASSTTPQFLFPTLQQHQQPKKDTPSPKVKRIENPLLTRNPPPFNLAQSQDDNNDGSFGGSRKRRETFDMSENSSPSVFANGNTVHGFRSSDNRSPLQSIMNTAHTSNQDFSNNNNTVTDGSANGISKRQGGMFSGAPPKASLSMMGFMAHTQRQAAESTAMSNNIPMPQRREQPFSKTLGKITQSSSPKPQQHHQVGQQQSHMAIASTSQVGFLSNTTMDDDSCWVFVYGYATQQQYRETLEYCKSLGQVVDSRGACRPGLSNWVAVEYQCSLQAQKAMCHNSVRLSSGAYIGIVALTRDLLQSLDASEFNLPTNPDVQNDISPATSSEGVRPFFNEPDIYNRSRIIQPKAASATMNNNDYIDERDILLNCDERFDPNQKSACEKVMGWCRSWTTSDRTASSTTTVGQKNMKKQD